MIFKTNVETTSQEAGLLELGVRKEVKESIVAEKFFT